MKQIEFIPIEEKTLNDQLVNLYGKHLVDLYHEVESKYKDVAIKPTMPFLLSLKSDDEANHLRDWEMADIKLMIFGRENNGWNDGDRKKEKGYSWECYNFNMQSSDDVLHEIRGRFEEGLPEIKGIQDTYEGYFYPDTSNDEFQCNDKVEQKKFTVYSDMFVEKLKQHMESKTIEYVWDNLYKIANVGKRGWPMGNFRDMESRLFNVVAEEVRILKPDAIIFMTGYAADNAIREKFGLPSDEFTPIQENMFLHRINFPGVKYAVRTIHPSMCGLSNAERERYDKALIEDMIEHFSQK